MIVTTDPKCSRNLGYDARESVFGAVTLKAGCLIDQSNDADASESPHKDFPSLGDMFLLLQQLASFSCCQNRIANIR